MSASLPKARPLDHLVLPVSSLELSRARYEKLGFTVAPDARHPFGTENACVFFSDGTYLEPLAIAQREDCEAAALKGNEFIARDQAFRFRQGEEGFSALVLGTSDAAADRKQFQKSGILAGKNLKFSRSFKDAKGKEQEASFELCFAADRRAPDAFFFTCERVKMPAFDRKFLTSHENGVIGLREVAASEPNPSDFQYLFQAVLNQRDINAHSFGIELAALNGNVAVYNKAGMKAWFNADVPTHFRGLRFRAFVLAVDDIVQTRKFLRRRKVGFSELASGRIVVDHEPGQGCIIAFDQG